MALPLQQLYTLGPGGTLNNPVRPTTIDGYGVITNPGAVNELELPLDTYTMDRWQAIPIKSITSAFPKLVWDDAAYPLRNLSVWPIPNTPIGLTVYSPLDLAQSPDLSVTNVLLPPGYMGALKYNLAIRLAPEYGSAATVSPIVIELAKDAKTKLAPINAPRSS